MSTILAVIAGFLLGRAIIWIMRRMLNLWLYGKWTNCRHGSWPDDWEPVGFADWRCPKCGVLK